jgi:carbon-monoxide dehydrogenase medium subunit
MNTRILPVEYEYLAPATLKEALSVLGDKEGVKILAGGTDLILKLKTDGDENIKYMMDVKRVPGLDYVRYDDGRKNLHIGPTATLSQIEKNNIVKEKYPALSEAISLMASVSVRNMGTMAGNICNASPVADSVVPAICYGAVLTLTSSRAERTLPVHEFFTAPGVSVMASDEMLTDIALPLPKEGTGAAFLKKARVRSDIAKLSVGVLMEREGQNIKVCRIAMGAAGSTPDYLKEVGDSIVGKKMTEQLISETVALAMDCIKPGAARRFPRSRWSTPEYKLHIAGVMTADAVREAWKSAGGDF